ncbi:T9SS type A sorting domain-containing protein [candidate division KSB1 bacterium]|nr:T9SS type A sorting domain-containing protein [candidate division KSB1 bacterium]
MAADRLQQLPATNFWYLGKNFEPEARLDYKFVLNGSTWILDPHHNKTVLGGFGPNSELAMPLYVKVVNVLGQTIWQQNWPNLNAGKHAVPLRTTLPPGIYFYQLQAAEKVLTKKMIVLP